MVVYIFVVVCLCLAAILGSIGLVFPVAAHCCYFDVCWEQSSFLAFYFIFIFNIKDLKEYNSHNIKCVHFH